MEIIKSDQLSYGDVMIHSIHSGRCLKYELWYDLNQHSYCTANISPAGISFIAQYSARHGQNELCRL